MAWFQETAQHWGGFVLLLLFWNQKSYRAGSVRGRRHCLPAAACCCLSLAAATHTTQKSIFWAKPSPLFLGGCVCVCTLFFLPLFFLFTWQGLRQMLLNILFQWEWGTWVAVGMCCLPRWRHASAVLLSPSVSILLSSLRTEVCRGGINFVWYLSGSSRVWSGILLPCEDDVVKWNPVTKTDGANLESVCKILQHLIKMVV